MLKVHYYALLTLLLLTASCASNDNEARVSLDNLVGLWNSSENVAGQSDVIYTRVTSDAARSEERRVGKECRL